MSDDLIKRSDAIAEIRKARTPDVVSYQYAELFINAVCRATSADRPQGERDIVTCGECKWLDSGKNDSEVWSMCTRHFGKYFDVDADDFCSYGEREGE